MTLLRRMRLGLLLGLALLYPRIGSGAEPIRPGLPGPLPTVSENQSLADTVARTVRASGTLQRYAVEVSVRGGAVELTGSVADQSQREEVLRLVQGVPGVVSVRDQLHLASTPSLIRPVQATDAPKLPAPLPDNGAKQGNGNGMMPEPAPMGQGPPLGAHDVNPPQMPPYAWPTYAPYNNFSRVAHPTAYPYNAWPFIGPVYPFPKVPLGWRSVKLEWDDGYWWFSRVGHKHNWWKIRYW